MKFFCLWHYLPSQRLLLGRSTGGKTNRASLEIHPRVCNILMEAGTSINPLKDVPVTIVIQGISNKQAQVVLGGDVMVRANNNQPDNLNVDQFALGITVEETKVNRANPNLLGGLRQILAVPDIIVGLIKDSMVINPILLGGFQQIQDVLGITVESIEDSKAEPNQ